MTRDQDVSVARRASPEHGRVEVRTAHSCDLRKCWLRANGFSGAEQVIRVERLRSAKGKTTRRVDSNLSSLARHEASAFNFLK